MDNTPAFRNSGTVSVDELKMLVGDLTTQLHAANLRMAEMESVLELQRVALTGEGGPPPDNGGEEPVPLTVVPPTEAPAPAPEPEPAPEETPAETPPSEDQPEGDVIPEPQGLAV